MMMCSSMPYPIMTDQVEDILRGAPDIFKQHPMVQEFITKAKESNMLIDATYGRRSRSVLVTDSDHVILSPIQPETIANRLSSEYEAAEEEESDE